MGLHNLKPAKGSRHRRKIIGRGEGSGHGGSATRGSKGQKARSGDGKMTGFEGGQIPLIRRIPKRGFTSRNKVQYNVINVETLNAAFESGAQINPEMLKENGIISRRLPVKILGDGKLEKAFTVTADAFSKSAEEKIKKAGGSIQKIQPQTKK
ncbi:MAG: 50S ribosomal protein L15 [Elusimicrobia bacterium RIFOXYA1_FULL_47_7]|nr:MAG: 50S ribosomal protein L15 [Elusimicrobia bacterium RIFOXYA12_FULL_49_49]OGS06156.1 MAG: 50S ribosomal protein L15 [Elusimicrobia bacterium RIFOXYA1_FULL_47_7]OGS14829.1 MAG: 50S ribosomal protein L15 [Elusimicrobia bacterium RIFOXYA2_FULL_47_53]OGS25768.1 MAG: 50S ribosomal protein L15 [Elusimicrobia bacterium RIFOXYB12_FULL_50_12]OGS31839.1 MAG: 50S ribosomal protein L15 [Elusimicrobia bacterium RIFOXYB2_FULL_46_23]